VSGNGCSLLDHFFALGPSMRPSATDKKSFSIVSFPDLRVEFLRVGFLVFLVFIKDFWRPAQ